MVLLLKGRLYAAGVLVVVVNAVLCVVDRRASVLVVVLKGVRSMVWSLTTVCVKCCDKRGTKAKEKKVRQAGIAPGMDRITCQHLALFLTLFFGCHPFLFLFTLLFHSSPFQSCFFLHPVSTPQPLLTTLALQPSTSSSHGLAAVSGHQLAHTHPAQVHTRTQPTMYYSRTQGDYSHSTRH